MVKLSVILRYWRSAFLYCFPFVLLPLPIIINTEAARCAYVMIIVAVFWMTEVLPLEITALIPVVGFPLLGVLSTQEVSQAYMNSTNMMNLGSLTIAVAIEHSNLHKRMALFIILHVGQSPRRLLAGFMMTTMFLSMWVNNIAVVVMMVPFLNAIVHELCKIEENANQPTNQSSNLQIKSAKDSNTSSELSDDQNIIDYTLIVTDNLEKELNKKNEYISKNYQNMKDMYFLGTAYAGNIGGSGSPLGSGANLVTKNLIESSFREDTGYNFGTWVLFNTPGMVVNTFLAWVWLQYYFLGFRKSGNSNASKEKEKAVKSFILKEYEQLGPMIFHELVIIVLFLIVLMLWFFLNPGFIDGWVAILERLFGWEMNIGDATPAVLIAVILFVLPCKLTTWPFAKMNDKSRPSEGCLTWDVVQNKLPWGAVLLLGGGFALAAASDKSGLSAWLGEQLKGLSVLPSPLIVLIVTIMTTATTEIASNTATSSILMPILRDLSLGICVNPLYLIVPATASCVYAFILPAATPPNVIVFVAAKMRSSTMLKVGIVMNIFCIIVINIMINTLGVTMFDVHNFPSWANSTTGQYVPTC